MNPIVYIVDDDAALCESLTFLFDSVKISYRAFHSASEFLKVYQGNTPGCLLLDIRMPMISGLCLQERLIKDKVSLPIIFMTGHGDIHMAVKAMKKGALDFLVKPFNHQLLLEAIQRGFRCSQARFSVEKQFKMVSDLTEQDHGIIRFIIQGDSSKVIAGKVGLSVKTIEYHRAKILRKLKLSNVVELAHIYTIYQNSSESKPQLCWPDRLR